MISELQKVPELEKVEKIIKKIEEDTEAEVNKILSEATEKAKEIKKEAEEKVRIIEEEILEKGKKEIEQEEQRIVANAKLKARKMKLDAKEDAIKATFEVAEEELKKLNSSKEYPNILQDLIEEAASTIGESEIEIIASKRDSKILTPDFLKNISKKVNCKIILSPETIDTYGGAVVRTKDRRIEVDNTLETRRARMKEDLRSRIAKVLFVGGKS